MWAGSKSSSEGSGQQRKGRLYFSSHQFCHLFGPLRGPSKVSKPLTALKSPLRRLITQGDTIEVSDWSVSLSDLDLQSETRGLALHMHALYSNHGQYPPTDEKKKPKSQASRPHPHPKGRGKNKQTTPTTLVVI